MIVEPVSQLVGNADAQQTSLIAKVEFGDWDTMALHESYLRTQTYMADSTHETGDRDMADLTFSSIHKLLIEIVEKANDALDRFDEIAAVGDDHRLKPADYDVQRTLESLLDAVRNWEAAKGLNP